MKRREFITLIGGATAAWPLTARAQQPDRLRRVGVLLPFAETDADTRAHLAIFREELDRLGWKDGRNLRIEYRWGRRRGRENTSVIEGTVELQPDVIVCRSTPLTAALLRETRTIQIVFVVVSDPVGDGLVATIARPGGNVTGFTNVEASLGGKWLELLKELSPAVAQVAVIFDLSFPKIISGRNGGATRTESGWRQ